MRKLLRALVVVSGIVFAALVLWIVVVLDSVQDRGAALQAKTPGQPTVFHFIAVMPALDRDLYHLRVFNGMVEAAKRSRSTVQVFEYQRGEGAERIRRLLRMVAAIKPDGIALALPSGKIYDAEIADLADRGVPVVAVEDDQPSSKRRAYVGTNLYEAGGLAGRLLSERFPNGADLAVLLAQVEGEQPSAGGGFVMGLRQGTRKGGELRIPVVHSAKPGSAAGEELVRSLLTSKMKVDAAVFTDARDAEGAAQALIEYGRVGAFAILAFDDTPEIRKLIDTGVVFASVARRPELTGDETVRALMALAKGERTSACIDPGVEALTLEKLRKERRP